MTKTKNKIFKEHVSCELEEKNLAYNQAVFKSLRLLVHLIAAIQFSFGVYYHHILKRPDTDDGANNLEMLREIERSHWGGKFKYLTFLNTILQACYHTLALLNDLFGSNDLVHSNTKKSSLRILRDYIFSSLAFPIAGNVCLSFWVIYAYDRELIFPAELDAIFPNWLNHIVHTNVAMMIVLDMFTCFREYPTRRRGVTGSVVFMLVYVVWIYIVRYYSGYWVYPLLAVLNTPMRCVMMSCIGGFTVLLYFVGEWLNGIVWAPELKLIKSVQTNKMQ